MRVRSASRCCRSPVYWGSLLTMRVHSLFWARISFLVIFFGFGLNCFGLNCFGLNCIGFLLAVLLCNSRWRFCSRFFNSCAWRLRACAASFFLALSSLFLRAISFCTLASSAILWRRFSNNFCFLAISFWWRSISFAFAICAFSARRRACAAWRRLIMLLRSEDLSPPEFLTLLGGVHKTGRGESSGSVGLGFGLTGAKYEVMVTSAIIDARQI